MSGVQQNTRQLAFDWGEAGEAQPNLSEGREPRSASARRGALAQGLMEAIVAAGNLRSALKRVRRNKGGPGGDGMTVEDLPDYLKQEWPRIKQELMEGRYQPQPVKRVLIPKPGGGTRQLGVPTVVDRFIQHAILQVLTPLYDPTFSPRSYGFRPGKSAHQAVTQAREHVARGKAWVVDIDLEAFFDRMNHDVLMGRLAKRIGDRALLRLIRRYLEAGILADGIVIDREEGTPQGGPLSPLLANVLLDELDRELERRGHTFCRYADDCNIYVASERAGTRVMETVTRFLERRLRLRVNRSKSRVARVRERTFLGFRIHQIAKARVSIAPESLREAKRTIRRITKRNRGASMRQMLAELGRFTDGWVGYFALARARSVFEALDQWVRRRVRCYQWKQWKTPRTRARALRQVGIGRWLAYGTAYDGPGLWRAAGSPALTRALPNTRLTALGYRCLVDRYDALTSV
jgi:RNA-directed DNA polymerase